MNARDASVPRQLARIKGAPALVLWLTQEVGCWVVGSRADFTLDRVTSTSDWDILVPWSLWEHVIGALPLESVIPTRRGGWRVRREGQPDIDVFPGEVGEWMKIPFVRVAWHPKSATVIEKVCELTETAPPQLDKP